jgi:hypothetical protein
LSVVDQQNLNNFKFLLNKNIQQKINDKHLWYSLIAKPTQSSFSRLDRLTCCFLLLFIAMVMNIMYYSVGDKTQIQRSTTFRIGNLQLDAKQVCFNQLLLFINWKIKLLI